MSFFDFSTLVFDYEPFPIGVARPLIEPGLYREMLAHFPGTDVMVSHAEAGRQGDKYTLSQKLDPRRYRQFVQNDPVWRDFHGWVTSDDFVYDTLAALRAHHIDLGYHRLSPLRRAGEYLVGRARGKVPTELSRLKARYEFSALSAAGGHLKPHTDSPGKIVTLVITMVGDGEWDPAWGGGTDVNLPRATELKFNQINRKAEFDDMDILRSFDFVPNQGVVFVKTYNSWHSIRPMRWSPAQPGEGPPLRRTLTINIEIVS